MAHVYQTMMSGAVAGALLILSAGGGVLGAEPAEAQARVEEARAAYEQAAADLAAAEAALAAARAADADPGAAAPASGAPAPEVAAEEPGFFDWDSWDKTVDIGLTGSSGNSENVNLRAQLTAERKTAETETTASALYRWNKQEGDNTESRARLEVRNDWLPPEGSRVRWWAQASYDYDEFQDWDHRVAAAAGIGYELIKNDKHTLLGRLGLGGSRTFGGEDEDFRPELVAGLEYAYQIKENHKFTAGTEAFIDISDPDRYRVNSGAQYEVLLDDESNMLFKTGVAHRYDSEPGGDAEKGDLEYYATMGWRF